MPSKTLSPIEQLTFQSGSVVQVQVSKIGEDESLIVIPRPKQQKGSSRDDTFSRTTKQPSQNDFQASNPRSTNAIALPQRSQPLKSAISPQKRMMATLKTGMNFTGVVSSITQYAAFVDIDVFRKAKGGVHARVNGMLHYSDLADKAVLATNKKAMQARNRGIQVLDKGTTVTVFVKEVLKNAG